MPLPFLPLLGAAARVFGAGMFSKLSMGGAGQAFKATRPVDVLALGRQLGTPNPSQEQIKAAQMGQLTSAAGGAAKALLGIPAATGAAISGLEGFGAAILSRRDQFAQYNAGIADSFAKIRRQDTMLSIRGGAAVSGSTSALAESFMALREDTQPMKEAMMNLWNVAGVTLVGIARIATKVLEFVGFLKLLEEINSFINTMFGGEGRGQGIQSTLKQQLDELRRLNQKVPNPKATPKPLTPRPIPRPGDPGGGGDFFMGGGP